MKLVAGILLLSGLCAASTIPDASARAAELDTRDCGCSHNNDAGRWDDDLKPSDRLNYLCKTGGGCWNAKIGKMCVTGNLGDCDCAVDSARNWESWHGNWFLWSSIVCGGLGVSITGN